MPTPYSDITKRIKQALSKFDKSIPGLQGKVYAEMLEQVKRLDISDGRIAVTVKNLSILNSIKGKLNRIILNDEYRGEIKDFAKAFNDVYKLQAEYWRGIESTFKPRPLLKAIRNQSITDVVKGLTDGIGANVSDALINILRTNITAGGSYAELSNQLRESLTRTPASDGILDRYLKTTTITSINQFNRQYTNLVSSDLGYEWFRYANTEIQTSRGFCQSMCEHRYFHISQVPELLQGKYLGQRMKYQDNETGETKTVEIYKRTGLPYGFIEGTNADNFFTNAGGWNCGHSIQSVNERQVPAAVVAEVEATAEYKSWKGVPSGPSKAKTAVIEKQEQQNLEDKIREHKFESLAVFKDGKQIFFKDGEKSQVSFTEDEMKLFAGNIVTHNHPGGRSFSESDLITFNNSNAKEIRAVSKLYDYSLSGQTSKFSYAELRNKYREFNETIRQQFTDKIDSGKMTIEQANTEHHHEVNILFADHFKLTYKRIEK